MTNAFQTLIPALATVALLGGNLAWAQEAASSPAPGEAAQSVLPSEAVPLPDVKTSGSVSYVTGGIPYEQLPAFTKARSEYPLNIEIYEKDGAKNGFTADAGVKLIDRNGNVVLDAKAEGPFLWAKVAPGQYRLQIRLNGKMKESRVAVGTGKVTRAVVVFPQGTSDSQVGQAPAPTTLVVTPKE